MKPIYAKFALFLLMPILLTILGFHNAGATQTEEMPQPYLIKDTLQGPHQYSGTTPLYFANLNGSLIFRTTDDDHGTEIWISDGTTEGTKLIKDINTLGDSNIFGLETIGNNVFFSANDGIHGYEPWITDGTEANTQLLKDINSGGDSTYRIPGFIDLNGTVIFKAYDDIHETEFWKTDGSPENTQLTFDSHPTGDGPLFARTLYKNELYYEGYLGNTSLGLNKTDGTEAGTSQIKKIAMRGLHLYNDLLFFSGPVDPTNTATPTDFELWQSDGTLTGTVMVKNLNPVSGSNPSFFTNAGDKLLFSANDGTHGTEIWITDGTEMGTTLVKDINPSATGDKPKRLFEFKDNVYFWADDGSHGFELWRSDGTITGTIMVKDIFTGTMSSVYYDQPWDTFEIVYTVGEEFFYFQANDGVYGFELWRSDGTEEGTTRLTDINENGKNSFIEFAYEDMLIVGNTLFFTAFRDDIGWALWGLEVGNNLPVPSPTPSLTPSPTSTPKDPMIYLPIVSQDP